MAYTVNIIKESVVMDDKGLFTLNGRCIVNDGTADVFDEVISIRFNPNETNFDVAKARFIEEFNRRWTKYVSEQAVLNSSNLDAAIADVKTQIETAINSTGG